ncbi:MAG: LPS export ABC transporter periplasmic protein LptC [Thermodesulfobacteriota bacterium]|nr:LPS export ABC transporter periplasmic protein LptC [Thermodesulfobacteriota bacterium]
MRTFVKRQWPLLGIGVLLAVVAFYLVKSGEGFTQGPILKEIMSGEGLKLKDIHFTQYDPDKGTKWVLNAAEVRYSGDKNSLLFHDFRLKLEPEDGSVFKLNGNSGDYSRDSGEIDLRGDLEGSSGDGYRIVTEHIRINEKTGLMTTDKQVKIFGPFFFGRGQGALR